jgi:hypothetical protein
MYLKSDLTKPVGKLCDTLIGDALTLLIMADKRAGQDVYGKVYSGDWADFTAKTQAWHARKRTRRTG